MGSLAVYQITDECTVGGGDAIAFTSSYPGKKRFLSFTINWTAGTAPTTGENLVITLNSGKGSDYDTVLFDQDMSTLSGGVVNLVLTSDDFGNLVMSTDDELTVAYTNTDDLGIGAVLSLEPGY